MPGWSADSRLTTLFTRRREDLLRLAILLTGSYTEGEDAVQDAVLAVGRSWRGLVAQASEAAAYSYLRTAVIRKVIDARRRRMPLGEIPDVAVEEPGFLNAEVDQRFFTLVAALPAQQRTVLVLRYHADLDDGRIATLLHVSRGTVRSNAMRGLDKLREQLANEETP